jgi:hypothetical protein
MQITTIIMTTVTMITIMKMMTITVIIMLIIKTNYDYITSINHNNVDNNNK